MTLKPPQDCTLTHKANTSNATLPPLRLLKPHPPILTQPNPLPHPIPPRPTNTNHTPITQTIHSPSQNSTTSLPSPSPNHSPSTSPPLSVPASRATSFTERHRSLRMLVVCADRGLEGAVEVRWGRRGREKRGAGGRMWGGWGVDV